MAPNARHKGTPLNLLSNAHQAVSTAAFANGFPLNTANRPITSAAESNVSPTNRGKKNSRAVSYTDRADSGEYVGA